MRFSVVLAFLPLAAFASPALEKRQTIEAPRITWYDVSVGTGLSLGVIAPVSILIEHGILAQLAVATSPTAMR